MCLPIARVRGVDADALFRRVWDQFVFSLREGDLISNEEQVRGGRGTTSYCRLREMAHFML